jgi:hypothetical protein
VFRDGAALKSLKTELEGARITKDGLRGLIEGGGLHMEIDEEWE